MVKVRRGWAVVDVKRNEVISLHETKAEAKMCASQLQKIQRLTRGCIGVRPTIEVDESGGA